jgi:hypothetical protein
VKDYLEIAYLCLEEILSFVSNGMERYNQNDPRPKESINDNPTNTIALMPGLRKAFRGSKFAIVPKDSHWTAHFLDVTGSLGREHHNRILPLVENKSKEFLLTRLALPFSQ